MAAFASHPYRQAAALVESQPRLLVEPFRRELHAALSFVLLWSALRAGVAAAGRFDLEGGLAVAIAAVAIVALAALQAPRDSLYEWTIGAAPERTRHAPATSGCPAANAPNASTPPTANA